MAQKEIKKTTSKKWYVVLAGVILFLISCIAIFNLPSTENGRVPMWLAAPAALIMVGSIVLIIYGFKIQSDKGVRYVSKGKSISTHAPNTINVLAKLDDKGGIKPVMIQFAFVKHPKGRPRFIENINQYMHVNINDIEEKHMKDVIIPDTAYCDPREYEEVLTMDADKDYWSFKEMQWQQAITVGALVIVIIVEWIVYLTTAGGA